MHSYFQRGSFSAMKLKTLYVLKNVSLDGSMKKHSANERRIVARPFELLGQFVAVNVAAVGHVRRAACNADALI